MLLKLPSIADNLYIPNEWNFRNKTRKSKLPRDSYNCTLKSINLHLNQDILNQPKNFKADLRISLNNDPFVEGNLEIKGRWRPGLPSGLLSFSQETNSQEIFIIFEDNINIKSKKNPFSDLSPAEIFDGEVLNYKLASTITSNSLHSSVIDCNLVFRDEYSIKTRGLIIESFHTINSNTIDLHLDNNKTTYESSLLFNAADLLNLEFFEYLIGNEDFYIGYDENGRFCQHNIYSTKLDKFTTPIPFDFQFTCILTPFYHKHRDHSLIESANINASKIIRKIRKIPGEANFTHYKNAIEKAKLIAAQIITSPPLTKKYIEYFTTFEKKLDEEYYYVD
ncbi:hypothetical protein TDB9533_00599 [Thalassocella blandensis]|nr:hypothetical protein TDB9533_00599 [Thalassocella blandensis]